MNTHKIELVLKGLYVQFVHTMECKHEYTQEEIETFLDGDEHGGDGFLFVHTRRDIP